MHGPKIATLLILATLGLVRPIPAGASDAVEEARRRLARNDGVAAVAVLEEALPEAGPERAAILEVLRKAYEMAASQAEAAGRSREAGTYRENLKILNRRPTATAAPAVEPIPQPAPAPVPLPEEPRAQTGPAPAIEPNSEPDPPAPAAAVEPGPGPASGPSGLPSLPAPVPVTDLATGDAAFRARDYAEAGRIYAELNRQKRLPAERTEHWAYCRSAAVVEQINAHPKSDQEWAAIDAEIDQIRAMNPNNWLGEYLRNRASERLVSRKKPRPGKTVVRASSPEEPATVDRPVRTASNPTPVEPPAAVPREASTSGRGASPMGRWQIRETANFRIYHLDPALAEKVAQVAESARHQQTKQWANLVAKQTWQPQCEVYLYPTARQYAQMTGQPQDSPGFSTMGMNGGKIISRRLNLRADHPTLLQAVLPHEITHVILADIFPTRQIPRWADEGLAVLAEPADEQERRAADLVGPLAANKLFPLDALMNMDYPDNRYWSLYYAQSVSLTRFLVEQGSPAQMIQFLQGSQRNGYEVELRRTYQIDGFGDLQRRWLAHARNLEPARTATASGPTADGPDLKVR